MTLFTNSTWPELTRLEAQGERAKLALANRLLAKVSCAVSLPIVATLFFVGVPLFEVWTRGRVPPDATLLRLLLVEVLTSVPWYAVTFVLVATSRIRGISNLYLFSGIANVVLCVLALKTGGIDGVGVVMIAISVGLFNVFVPRWAMEAVGETTRTYLRAIWLPYAALTGVTFAVAWQAARFAGWASTHTGLHNLAVWLALHSTRLGPIADVLGQTCIVATAALVTAVGLSWRFFFGAEERAVLVRSLRAIVVRRAAAVQPGVIT